MENIIARKEDAKILVLRSGTDIDSNRTGGARYQAMALEALRSKYKVEIDYVYFKEKKNSGLHRLIGLLKLILKSRKSYKDADIFLLDGRTMLTCKRQYGKKYIGVFHHYWIPDHHNTIKKFLSNVSTRIGIKKVDVLITVSKYWQDYFKALGAKDVRVIYNAFEMDNFSQEELEAFKKNYGLCQSVPIIYIGNNSAEKGVIEVYNQLKNDGYLLVTSGVKKTDIPVLHLDLKYEDYLKLLASSTLVITMSKLAEGWCRTAHEAMLMKTPVIGSGVAGMAELLEGGGQVICKDINKLSLAVEDLLSDKERMKSMALNGYNFAKTFTKEKFVRDWINLVESANTN